MAEHRLSERQACRLLEVTRGTYRYEGVPDRNRDLRAVLIALAHEKKSYGYRRLWAVLTRRGWKVNLKRVHRLYREEKLMARPLKRKRIIGVAPLAGHLTGPDQEWAIDFVADAIQTGRGIRILTIVDSFTRECPALLVDTSLSGQQVTRLLERVIEQRDRPLALRCDNGLNASLFSWHRRRWTAQFATSAHRVNRRYRIGHRVVFHEQRDPAHHNEHKICGNNAQSLQRLKQHEGPVEGPSIIYEVEIASTARARGIDPLGSRCSKKRT
jgi:putative transposase